ncbi:MAG: glycoside hydrolase family 130 protein [Oscillospiraceae bacterium]|jgi:beta-1,4-mannooligosaccharide/beta-1,4-mannosyl-N-acetylglucosamine phosphorylase|nr:glycoside hydrolase family 130 protein [Oscillospiraceae bacterium]
MSVKIIGLNSLPNIPWEEKPAGCNEVVRRYSGNPIIKRDQLKCGNSIFNSAVVPFGEKFAGVFRVDDKRRNMQLHVGFSDDAINWELSEERIDWLNDDAKTAEANPWQYGYDPRVVFIEDRWWVTWCNAYGWKPTIGVGYTFDFKEFRQCENAFLPFNRNGVLFPRKINGKYVMFSRPSDSGHTPFGDIYISQSPDMKYWGEHRHVMAPKNGWESKKIGAGPIPIETSEGWLCIYHGVLESCNGFVYSFGAAVLDIDEPWKVKYRCQEYLLSPQTIYECTGDVPNVAFPCAALCDPDTGRLAIYYGCADTHVGLAFANADELVEYVKEHS